MTRLPLERNVILPRLNGIAEDLAELRRLGQLPEKEFAHGPGYKVAYFHLHRALEGVFNIGNHILSRIPGGAGATQYKEVARLLGEKGIVPRGFADETLVRMAGYRVRLVHFYAEVTPKEMYQIIRERPGDIEEFVRQIKRVLEHPESFGLTLA